MNLSQVYNHFLQLLLVPNTKLSSMSLYSSQKPNDSQLLDCCLPCRPEHMEQNSESGREGEGEGGKCTVAQGEKLWRREK